MAEKEEFFEEELLPDEEALQKEATTRFREVFVYGGENERYVLTYLLNMLCFWERCETEEQTYLRNAATEILKIIGIGRPIDRQDLIGVLLDFPIK